nr:hypothetical protein [Nesterenkonia sp. AN1]
MVLKKAANFGTKPASSRMPPASATTNRLTTPLSTTTPVFWLNVVLGMAPKSAPSEVPMPSAMTPPLSWREVGDLPIAVRETAVRSPMDSIEEASAMMVIAMMAALVKSRPKCSGVGAKIQSASATACRLTMPKAAATA